MFFYQLSRRIFYLIGIVICSMGCSFSASTEFEAMNVRRLSTDPFVQQLTGTVLISGFQEARFNDQLNWFKRQALGDSFTIDYSSKTLPVISEEQTRAMDQYAQTAVKLTLHYIDQELEENLPRVVDREHMLFVIRSLNLTLADMEKLCALQGHCKEDTGVGAFSLPVNHLAFDFFSLDLEERDLFEQQVLRLFKLNLNNSKTEGWSLIRVLAHRLSSLTDKGCLTNLIDCVIHQVRHEKGEEASLSVAWVASLMMQVEGPIEGVGGLVKNPMTNT